MRIQLSNGRKQAFLEALRLTGSLRAAARMATPGNSSFDGPHSTFRMAIQRDPAFAAAAQEALDDALGRMEAEAMRRAVEGYQRPVYQKGELVGHETVYSDNMLLMLLRARAPDVYSERRDVRVSGQVQHSHNVLTIDASDLLLLDQSDSDTLLSILAKLANAKGEAGQGSAPLLEHNDDK